MRAAGQLRLNTLEYHADLVVMYRGASALYSRVFRQVPGSLANLVDQHIHADNVLDEVLAEARIAGDDSRLPVVQAMETRLRS